MLPLGNVIRTHITHKLPLLCRWYSTILVKEALDQWWMWRSIIKEAWWNQLAKLKKCLRDIKTWFTSNFLPYNSCWLVPLYWYLITGKGHKTLMRSHWWKKTSNVTVIISISSHPVQFDQLKKYSVSLCLSNSCNQTTQQHRLVTDCGGFVKLKLFWAAFLD